MATLNYSGDLTTDVQTIKSLIEQGVQLHSEDTPVSIDSASLRLQDDGQVRLIISISATGDMEMLTDLQSQVAQSAVDLGFEESIDDAENAVQL